MMSEEMKLLNYFDTIFGTNTINHIEIDMPLLKFIFYELSENLKKANCEYKKFRKEQLKISNELILTLKDNQNTLFNDYGQITNKLMSVEDFQLFCFGYLLAKELDIESKIKKE